MIHVLHICYIYIVTCAVILRMLCNVSYFVLLLMLCYMCYIMQWYVIFTLLWHLTYVMLHVILCYKCFVLFHLLEPCVTCVIKDTRSVPEASKVYSDVFLSNDTDCLRSSLVL